MLPPSITVENLKLNRNKYINYIIYDTMTYFAKVPRCIYKQYFDNEIELDDGPLYPIVITVQFVVVDKSFEKMRLNWYCRNYSSGGVFDEEKCETIKKKIHKWIIWYKKYCFTKADLD